MPKKAYLIVGLVLIACAISVVYWKMQESNMPSSNSISGTKLATDCEKAEFPFACYLDKAMAAKDPSLCVRVGREKRINCLQAYSEILGQDIDCSKLTDPEFSTECSMNIFKEIKEVASDINTVTTGSQPFITDGLNVDRP